VRNGVKGKGIGWGIVKRSERWNVGTLNRSERDPKWELLVPTPAVFARVANAGLRGYGTWKGIRNSGGTGGPAIETRRNATRNVGTRRLAGIGFDIHERE
jgi:hypothetical protein